MGILAVSRQPCYAHTRMKLSIGLTVFLLVILLASMAFPIIKFWP